MSCNYADGLSPYENKGKLGLPEIKEEAEVVEEKVKILAKWIKEAKHVVFHTGAGISTQAGIPDFRGPNGVWTLEEKGLKPDINTSFDNAQPTVTHMTLKSMIDLGYAKFVISQNIDGLHLKSGLKRTSVAELHGNMFVARCSFCEKYTVLSNCAGTVGEKSLGVDCPYRKPGGRSCRGILHDTLLDWEANLPPSELETADLHSALSDLSICLGTTLQIIPAGNLPLKAKKNPGGRVVIVNLQSTKHDKKADLIINSYVDVVMEKLAHHLGLPIPKYCSDLDPTRLLQSKRDNLQEDILFDWTIPASSIKLLKNQVKNLPKKETVRKPQPPRKKYRPAHYIESEPQVEVDIVKPGPEPQVENKIVKPGPEPQVENKIVKPGPETQVENKIVKPGPARVEDDIVKPVSEPNVKTEELIAPIGNQTKMTLYHLPIPVIPSNSNYDSLTTKTEQQTDNSQKDNTSTALSVPEIS